MTAHALPTNGSLTFVHTADWHLGRTYWGLGKRATESAQWRVQAIRNIWSLAQESGAAFILVAGDVFDSETPSPYWRQTLLSLLADAPAPVFLIPGNHDVAAEGSVWRNPEFMSAFSQVKCAVPCLESHPVQIGEGVWLFPCPVGRKHAVEDPTAWIGPGDRGKEYRIGLAHGHLQGYFSAASQEGFHPIAAHRAEISGLDYLALGDYHGFTPADHAATRLRSYYSGAPEVGARDDNRAGYAMLVKLQAPGAVPEVVPHRVGQVEVAPWGEITLAQPEDLESLAARGKQIADPAHTILRLKLRGQIFPAMRNQLDALLLQWNEQFLGLDNCLADLHILPSATDFEALQLEPLEQSILDALQTALPPEAATRLRCGATIESWSQDPSYRREALNLYYQYLKESS